MHDYVIVLKFNSLVFIRNPYEELLSKSSTLVLSIEKPLVLELNLLPSHVKYAHLGEEPTLLVIISLSLTLKEEEKLLRVLWECKIALGC